MALLYMFRVTISPIIKSTYAVYGHYCGEISPTRCNNCVFILRNGFTLYVSSDNFTHHQEYNAVYGHLSAEISPTRCNNCVFILRNGFTLHVSGAISPIIRITMIYMAIIVVKYVQQDATIAFLFSAMALLYMYR